MLCLGLEHEECAPGLPRYLEEDMFPMGSGRCMACHEDWRLQIMVAIEAEESSEDEGGTSEEELKRCGCRKHSKWWTGGRWLPVEKFYKNKSKIDGLQNCCKFCMSEIQKQNYRKRKAEGLEEEEGARKKCLHKKHRRLSKGISRRQPVEQFSINYNDADKRCSHCKSCEKALIAKRRKVYSRRNKKSKDVIPSGTKRCRSKYHVGERDLPYTQFSRNRTAPDGFCSECKACRAEYYRARRADSNSSSSSSYED